MRHLAFYSGMVLSVFSLSAMQIPTLDSKDSVVQMQTIDGSRSDGGNESPTLVQQIPANLEDDSVLVQHLPGVSTEELSECSIISESSSAEEVLGDDFSIYEDPIYTTPHAELFWLMTTGRVARILSLDGGGIRGVFSAVILQYIEEQVGMPIIDIFHLLAGTSTGGLLATALSIRDVTNPIAPKFKAADIVDLYTTRGSLLFQKINPVINLFRGFRSSYYTDPLEAMFQEICGDRKLSDIPTDLIITYHNLTNGSPSFFKSHFARESVKQKARQFSDDTDLVEDDLSLIRAQAERKDYYLRNVVRATSAAPTYFDPLHLMTIEELSADSELFVSAIDGGLFANDPSLCALTEAFKIYPNSDAYFVLSIGTGRRDQVTIADPKTLLGWATLAPEILMSNAEQMVKHMIKTLGLIYNKKVFFLKVQVSLPAEHASMDDTSSINIEYLKQRAREYIAHPSSPINNLINLLKITATPREDLIQRPEQQLTTNFRDLGEGFTL